MKALALVAGLLFLGLPTNAQDAGPINTGNDVLLMCVHVNDEVTSLQSYADGVKLGTCITYMSASRGAFYLQLQLKSGISQNTAEALVPICIPSGVTDGQLLRVVLKYLNDNPAELNNPLIFLVHAAFRGAFPCGAAK